MHRQRPPPRHRATHHRAPARVLPRSKTRILILNGNGRAGAASQEASIVRSMGYRVAAVGNAARSDYGRTTVLYPQGRTREARRLAHDLGIKLVGPLDGISRAKMRHATVARHPRALASRLSASASFGSSSCARVRDVHRGLALPDVRAGTGPDERHVIAFSGCSRVARA